MAVSISKEQLEVVRREMCRYAADMFESGR